MLLSLTEWGEGVRKKERQPVGVETEVDARQDCQETASSRRAFVGRSFSRTSRFPFYLAARYRSISRHCHADTKTRLIDIQAGSVAV